MKKRNNYYTFMFFPEGKGNSFTLRIHRYTLYLTIISFLMIIAGLIILLYKTGEIGLKLQLVQGLKEENARLWEHNRDLQISSEKIANIDSLAVYLHRLSGISDAQGAPIGDVPRPVVSAQVSPDGRPITQVEITRERGEAQRSAPVSTSGEHYAASMPNIIPVNGWFTKHFSLDTAAGVHYGLDIAAAHGTPIRATAMGVVDDIRNDKYLGLLVEIRHENGYVTRYSHCSQVLVSVSDRVNRGQTIALVGNTGRSTAPHLHYEVLKFGKNVDPMNYIGADKQ